MIFAMVGLVLAGPALGQEYLSAEHGFRLEPPAGWGTVEKQSTREALHVVFEPTGGGGSVQLSVRVQSAAVLGDAEGVRRRAVEAVLAGDQYGDPLELELELSGESVPGLEVDARSGGARLRLRQRYASEQGLTYVLQELAPVEEFERWSEVFETVWTSFRSVPVPVELRRRQELEALAARCGSQVEWAEDWKEAARRASRERKLVLVTARMYQSFGISDERMVGSFTEPGIVALLNERYVPLDLSSPQGVPFADPEVYGLSGTTFGSAALLVTPEGEVAREGLGVTFEFLVAGLDAHPKYPGPKAQRVRGAVENARRALVRGELERVLELLSEEASAPAALLRARVHRLRREGAAALAALDAVPDSNGAGELAFELDLERAVVELRTGEAEAARTRLESLLAGGPEHEAAPEARFWLGALLRVLEGPEAARAAWQPLLDGHPDSPWAWIAAGTLVSTAWELGVSGDVAWPGAELARFEAIPAAAPLPIRRAEQARQDVIAYLLESQLSDGSWYATGDLMRRADEPPTEFKLAVTAICARSLLPYRGQAGVAPAVERAYAWLREGYERITTGPDQSHFMDYAVWSRSAALGSLAAAVRAGAVERALAGESVAGLVEDLRARRKRSGGWSYYLTTTLGTSSGDERGISFTTAAVLDALLEAREVEFDVPAELIEGGLEALERARVDDGYYEYWIPVEGRASRTLGVDGAAGRGPLCAGVLMRGGRVERGEVLAALELFVEHRGSLAKETGKVLMHTGPSGQGSHYLLFDYAHAAPQVVLLPRSKAARTRDGLLEVVLQARCEGGTFVDNPSRGPVYGAGMALLALDALIGD